MNSITVMGTGCVGLVTGANLADSGSRGMDPRRLEWITKSPVLCDLRNIHDPAEVEAAGMTDIGVGRGRPPVARKGNA